MWRKKFCLTFSFFLVFGLAGSSIAQDVYYWTNASGDGMWNRDAAPYNWERAPAWNPDSRIASPPPPQNSGNLWISGNPTTLSTPLVIPAGYDANCTNGEDFGTIYGPEWGLNLDIYGKLGVVWTIAPVQGMEGLIDPNNPDNDPNRSVINMYDGSEMYGPDANRMEILCLGLSWWYALPYVTMNMYGDSVVYTNAFIFGGHLNMYGGTLDVLNYVNLGTRDSYTVPDNLIRLNIEQGRLILPPNSGDQVQDWIDRGILKAYGETPGLPKGAQINVDMVTIPDRSIVTAIPQSPPEASTPRPANAATEVLIDTNLNWRAGFDADRHDVFISTDANDVNDVNSANLADYPNVTYENVNINTFAPANLDMNTTYYWRVDEVNDAHPDRLWKGKVWSFTTANYIVVDDFEAYNDLNVDEEGTNRIYLTWTDGYDNPTVNGSTIGYPNPFFPDGEHFVEVDIFHSGNQSAPLLYDNSVASYSEVTVNTSDLTIGSDWTKGDVQVLTLWIYGDPNNPATEQLYIKINAAKVTYDIDPTQTTWQEITISLADFNTDLSNVSTFSIGFERTGATGGSGRVFIDDIRLYLSSIP